MRVGCQPKAATEVFFQGEPSVGATATQKRRSTATDHLLDDFDSARQS